MLNEHEVIDALVGKVIAAMTARGYKERDTRSLWQIVGELRSKGVHGLSRWLREVQGRLGDREQYLDVYAQGWFARIFTHNGLRVTMNPRGGRGPDLAVEWCQQLVYVEVGRLRPDYEERRRLEEGGPGGMLVPYGRGERDVWKLVDTIVAKSRQGKGVPEGHAYLIAIRIDKESLENDIDPALVAQELENQQSAGGAGYGKVSAVLFHYKSVSVRSPTPWQVWENPAADRPLPPGMGDRLRTMDWQVLHRGC